MGCFKLTYYKDNGPFLKCVWNKNLPEKTAQWFCTVDPMAHEREWLSPYNFVSNNPLNRVDPTGALDDWVEKTDNEGNKSIVWDENVTSADDADLQKGDTYLGKAVVVMDGSSGENLGADGTLQGEGANPAKVTVYGPGGADDILTYDGLTITSNPDTYTKIASGDYEGFYQPMASSSFGKGSLTYRVRQLDGNLQIPTEGGEINQNKNSPAYGTPFMTSIFFHRTNWSGWAGYREKSNGQPSAVSTGCPIVCGTQWRGVEKQLGKISSFRLRIIR